MSHNILKSSIYGTNQKILPLINAFYLLRHGNFDQTCRASVLVFAIFSL